MFHCFPVKDYFVISWQLFGHLEREAIALSSINSIRLLTAEEPSLEVSLEEGHVYCISKLARLESFHHVLQDTHAR